MPSPPASFFEDGFEMPSFNIRNSIANKVVAKKIVKGYTISEEKCNLCDMNLMTLKGTSECKVCPAIKKWVQRKNEQKGAAACKIEEQIEEAREAVETVEQEADEIRDAAPADSVDMGVTDQEPEEGRDAAPADSFDMDQKSSREVEAVGSDERSDFEPPSINDSESADGAEVGASASGSYEQEDDEDDDRYLSKSRSEESDETEDTDAIRERARQIIMKARAGGGGLSWESGSDDSDEDSDDDDSSADGSNFQERAGEIINNARRNIQQEHGLEFPPHMISPRMDDVDNQLSSSVDIGVEPYESVDETSIKEQVSYDSDNFSTSIKEQVSYDSDKFSTVEEICVEDATVEETTVNEEASSPKSSNNEEASVDEEVISGMESYEAAILIQSLARRYLVKSKKCEQVKEQQEGGAIEEAMQTTGSFESLGISTPTGDDEDFDNTCNPSPSNVQEEQQHKEETSGGPEDVVQDSAPDGSQDVGQDVVQDVGQDVEGVEVEVGFELSQDEANPVSPNKDSCVAAPDTDRSTPIDVEAPNDSSIAAPESGRIAVEAPEFNNGVVPQQQDVTASDYAIAPHREPASRMEHAIPKEGVVPPSKDRGLFASLACKFDDAVSDAIGKVHSLVTCTTNNEDTRCQAGEAFEAGSLAEAFEAEQNELRANSFNPGHFQCDGQAVSGHSGQVQWGAATPGPYGQAVSGHLGQVQYDAATPGPSNYDAQMMLLASRGWPQQMMVPTHPEHHANSVANHAGPHAGMNFVSSQGSFAHYGPPRPESVANRAPIFNGVPPCQQPSPNHVAPSFAMNPAAPGHLYMMEMNRHLDISNPSGQPFFSQTPLGSLNNINQGTNPMSDVTAVHYGPATGQVKSANQHTNANPLSDVTAAHYGPAADQAKSTSKPPTVPKPNQTVSSKPPLPGPAAQNYRPQAECTPRLQDVIAPSPNVHNQVIMQNTIAPAQVPMMQNTHKQTVMQQAPATPNQAQMMHNAHNLMMQMQLGPNHNQMMQMPPRDRCEQGDDTKENESGGDNVSKQLQDAKNRIEDAKKFIMSRSNRSMAMPMPPVGAPSPMLNNMPPGAQWSLSTPNSQGNIKPQMNPEIFRTQMSMPSTQGASQAGTPQVMRQMGSLMSPGTSPAEEPKHGDDAELTITSPSQMRSMVSPAADDQINVTAVEDPPAQMSSSPVSQHDGYPSPEMPSRYFFA